MKTETIEWNAFMSGEYKRPSVIDVIVAHLERNKIAYRIIGAAVIIFIGLDIDQAHAAAADIDSQAREIYKTKLVKFGKWVIIIKGGWSTISKALNEDFEGAKKSILGYLLVLAIMLGFPWACDQIEDAFKGA